jgi:hypothetical protein
VKTSIFGVFIKGFRGYEKYELVPASFATIILLSCILKTVFYNKVVKYREERKEENVILLEKPKKWRQIMTSERLVCERLSLESREWYNDYWGEYY